MEKNIWKKSAKKNIIFIEQKIEQNIKEIIKYIGADSTSEHLKDTPRRVREMYSEIFKGYDKSKEPPITTFKNDISKQQIIIDTGTFRSFCAHHMLPFSGNYYVGYIPINKIIGLSKFARIIDYLGSKLQSQELLTKEIADFIIEKVSPKGVAVVLKSNHTCKSLRGIKTSGQMITSEMRGVFLKAKKNYNQKLEFLELIRNG